MLNIRILAAPLLALLPLSGAWAAAKSPFSITGGATVVSDYRFRGISQTNKGFALQGTGTVSHSSGFYGTIWGSSIDDYVASGSDVELDLILGYKRSFGSTTIDGGILYYYYPGSGGGNTDFAEPYISLTHAFGPVTVKALAAYAPKQNGLSIGNGREDNLYLAGDLGYAIPSTPVSLTGHFGHSFGPSYLTIGRGYSDWSLGAAVTHRNLVAGLSYVDTNKSLAGPTGRNIAGSAVVASLGVTF